MKRIEDERNEENTKGKGQKKQVSDGGEKYLKLEKPVFLLTIAFT